MKLYLKRNSTESGMSFTVYDRMENIIFNVVSSVDSSLRMTVESRNGEPFSVIRLNTLLFTYFTVRCSRHFYVLIPCVRDHFAFAIYGSTYKFAGNLAAGEFTMTDSKGEIIMTINKTITRSGDEAFELEIKDEEHKMFMISAAICAASYQILAEPNTPQICC